jgi:hypothetical protein
VGGSSHGEGKRRKMGSVAMVWSSGGGSWAAPRDEKVGEGPGPTGRRRVAGSSPAAVFVGGACVGSTQSASKHERGSLMGGPSATVPGGAIRFDLDSYSNEFKRNSNYFKI